MWKRKEIIQKNGGKTQMSEGECLTVLPENVYTL